MHLSNRTQLCIIILCIVKNSIILFLSIMSDYYWITVYKKTSSVERNQNYTKGVQFQHIFHKREYLD